MVDAPWAERLERLHGQLRRKRRPTQIFVAYARDDVDARARLCAELEPFEKDDELALWFDFMVRPGEHWDDAIQERLLSSDIIVFLVSAAHVAVPIG